MAQSRTGVLAGLSLAMLLSSLGTSVANVALPTLAREFSAPFQEVQWIVLAYLLAVTTLIVGVGRLGDIAGRRRVLLVGIGLFTVASIGAGAAPSLGLLIVARGVQGLGGAIMMALTVAFVGEAVPKERTGSAIGLLGTMSAIGTALGPSLGGILIAGLGWRAIFFVNVPAGLLAVFLVRRYLPADRQAAGTAQIGLDPIGTLVLALTLAAYAVAMTLGRGLGWINLGLLAAAAVGVGLFGLVEKRTSSPLIRLATIRDSALRTSLLVSALVATVMMATLVVGPFYLSRTLGLDPALVGFVMSIGPLAAAITAAPAGRLADRFGASRMTIVGLTAIGAGSLALASLSATLGVAGYLAPIIAVTAGYAMFQTGNNTSVMHGIAPDQRGVTSGLLGLSRNLGLISGASMMGAVFRRAAGTTDIAAATAEAVAAGTRVTFSVAAGLVVGALILVWRASAERADRGVRAPTMA